MADIFQNNDYQIIGTIYQIDFHEINGVKDPSKTYAKYIVTLEVSKKKEYSRGEAGKGFKTYTEFPQFEAFGQDLSDYAVGELVKIHFSLSGKEYTRSDGKKGIFGKNILNYIHRVDIEGKPVGKANATEDEKVFSGANPEVNTEDESSDLPF